MSLRDPPHEPPTPSVADLWHPVLLPLLLLFFGVADHAFRLLWLSATAAAFVLAASLLGGIVNLPLSRRRVVLVDPAPEGLAPLLQWLLPVVHYYPPRVVEQVVALNVGGAVVPLVVSTCLLTRPHATVGAALATTTHAATVPVSPAPAARLHPALLSVVGNLAAITVNSAIFRPQAQVATRVYLRATPDSSWVMMGRTSARTGAEGLFAVTPPAPASPRGLSLVAWSAHVLATAVDRQARLELSAQNTVDDGWGL